MDNYQISQVLKINEVSADGNIYTLRLQFVSGSQAESNAKWQKLKTDFKAENSTEIYEFLYFAFINTYKISDPAQTLLVIRHSYADTLCPVINYFYNDDKKDFTLSEKLCKADYYDQILLKNFIYFNKEFIVENSDIAKEVYYRRILGHIKRVYTKQKGFSGNSPNAKFVSKFKEGDEVLEFHVSNLEKEVLYDSGENVVYQLLELITDKNYVPKEYIKFKITLTPNKATNQMKLHVHTEARYSSGIYQTNNWSQMNDMDKGFPTYADDYAEMVANEIFEMLTDLSYKYERK